MPKEQLSYRVVLFMRLKDLPRVICSSLLVSLLLAPLAEARHHESRLSLAKPAAHAAAKMQRSGKRWHKPLKSNISNSKRLSRRGKVACRTRVPLKAQTGALFINESGEIILDQLSDTEFNPASVVKLITALAAVNTFGHEHRFCTNVYAQGEFDAESATVNGDIYLEGCDPDFEHFDAVALKKLLVQSGIKKVTGRLLVSKDFSYGSVASPIWSARALQKVFSSKSDRIQIGKSAALGKKSESAELLLQYESEPFKETLKEMLSFSENNVAEQIGRALGGVKKVEEIAGELSGLAPGALKLASASGLGKSRVKPKDMMLVLKALRQELQLRGLDFADICPVAGVDQGTLDERFTDPLERGSVVAKTGTLPGTDGGTSTLAGMFRSRLENVYFVIFCWRGSVASFRKQQDDLIRKFQGLHGGALPYEYQAKL